MEHPIFDPCIAEELETFIDCKLYDDDELEAAIFTAQFPEFEDIID